MKKFLFFFLFVLTTSIHAHDVAVANSSSADESNQIVLRAGTEVPVQIISPIKAADVRKGQIVPFRVSKDICVNGVTLIPYGTIVRGTVYMAKKSSWWGTKGKLGIQINNIVLPNGAQIPLNNGNVYVTGTNRTPLSVLLFCFVTIPACAICGSKAEIPVGYEHLTTVAENIVFNVDGTVSNCVYNSQNTLSLSANSNNIQSINDTYSQDVTSNELLIIPNKKASLVDYNGYKLNCLIVSDDNDRIYYKVISRKGKVNSTTNKISKKLVKDIIYQE
ncbi:MAG: hypothetical protein U0K35_06825 [Prevotella sp.]|nr:hypothetical protein [Prevotella sp.]